MNKRNFPERGCFTWTNYSSPLCLKLTDLLCLWIGGNIQMREEFFTFQAGFQFTVPFFQLEVESGRIRVHLDLNMWLREDLSGVGMYFQNLLFQICSLR
jgi:hypothetical protein